MQTKPNFLVGGSSKLSRTSKPNTIPKRAPRLQKVIECHSSLIFIQNIVKAAAVIPAKQMVYLWYLWSHIFPDLTVIFMLFWQTKCFHWCLKFKKGTAEAYLIQNRLFDAIWYFLKQQTRAANLPIKFWTLVGNTMARKKCQI